ncbi:MAG: hypothetical protein E6G51_05550 [Actinobacteria bacterium]|nr:MAG: hypothetical protein E6G51_05550 [Actinomycetota bacterium]
MDACASPVRCSTTPLRSLHLERHRRPPRQAPRRGEAAPCHRARRRAPARAGRGDGCRRAGGDQELANKAGAEVVSDPEDAGHVEAALAGIARAEVEGAEQVVLLAGDCPLLDPRELDRLLTGVPDRYVGIVPDRHGTGTNALLLSPPNAIVPSFGEGSRDRHVESARATGIPFAIENLPSIELDLDTPADAIALTRELAKNPKRARRTAKALGI